MSEFLSLLKLVFCKPKYIAKDKKEEYNEKYRNSLEVFKKNANLKIKKVHFYGSPMVMGDWFSRFALQVGCFHSNLYLETDDPDHPGFFLTRGKYRHIMFFGLDDRKKIELGTAYDVGFDPSEVVQKRGAYSFPIHCFETDIDASEFVDFIENEHKKPYQLLSNNCTHLPYLFLREFTKIKAKVSDHNALTHLKCYESFRQHLETEIGRRLDLPQRPFGFLRRNHLISQTRANLDEFFNDFFMKEPYSLFQT